MGKLVLAKLNFQHRVEKKTSIVPRLRNSEGVWLVSLKHSVQCLNTEH